MSDIVIAETRAWVDRAVIGLNLCPFAKAPQVKGQVRYVVSEATDPETLLACLIGELQQLADTEHACFETTLLIRPQVLTDFADYNDFLGLAEDAISGLELDGVIQVASFHPQYRFAGSAPDDVSNATNRSPYPDAASDPRGQHRPRGGRLPEGRGDLRDQHRHDAAPGR